MLEYDHARSLLNRVEVITFEVLLCVLCFLLGLLDVGFLDVGFLRSRNIANEADKAGVIVVNLPLQGALHVLYEVTA